MEKYGGQSNTTTRLKGVSSITFYWGRIADTVELFFALILTPIKYSKTQADFPRVSSNPSTHPLTLLAQAKLLSGRLAHGGDPLPSLVASCARVRVLVLYLWHVNASFFANTWPLHESRSYCNRKLQKIWNSVCCSEVCTYMSDTNKLSKLFYIHVIFNPSWSHLLITFSKATYLQ